MSDAPPSVSPLGEAALTVTLGDRISLDLHLKVCAVAEAIRTVALPAVQEIVPGYATVTLYYDPAQVEYAALARTAMGVVETAGPESETAAPRHLAIPVRYDGPDLPHVAEQTGLAVAEVIARHAAPEYRVYLMGFVPGFAYLGGLDPSLALPRRGTPRRRVPAGSVAIGGSQAAVYPLETPGGWHLIGRTDLRLFDPHRTPPALLKVGDRVRFTPLAS